MCYFIFSLTILIAKVVLFALPPLYLGSLYAQALFEYWVTKMWSYC